MIVLIPAVRRLTTDLELHFEVDRNWGQVWAELRNPDGTVAETMSASEAVALACGDASTPLLLAA